MQCSEKCKKRVKYKAEERDANKYPPSVEFQIIGFLEICHEHVAQSTEENAGFVEEFKEEIKPFLERFDCYNEG